MSLLLLTGCASLPENLLAAPQIRLTNIEIVGLGLKSQTFLLSFAVENPNPVALPVSRIGYAVKLEGQRFASGETSSDLNLPANGNGQFAITVDLNLLATGPQVLALVRDGTRRSIDYELQGVLGVDLPLVPELRYSDTGSVSLQGSAASFLAR